MNYKEAIKIAQASVKTARQQIELAADVLDEFTSGNGYVMWSTLKSLQHLIYNIHYYIMENYKEEE